MTSTEEASENFTLFSGFTGSSLTLKLYFEKALDDAIELFLIGERFSQDTVDSARNKETDVTKDSATLQHMILQIFLAVAFVEIWSADNFSKQPVTTQMPTNVPAFGFKL